MGAIFTPSVYHTELIDGQEVEKPLPKDLHAFIQGFLLVRLAQQLPRKYRVLPELNVLCGSDRIIPDITVPLRSARYHDGDLADPAFLCVEILSPGQTISNLFDKAERILGAGTPLCWVIWPERRQAWHYGKDRLAEAKEELVVDLADGDCVRVSLAELWSELD